MKIVSFVVVVFVCALSISCGYFGYVSGQRSVKVPKCECQLALQGCELVATQCLNDVLEAEFRLNRCISLLESLTE